MTCGYRPLFYTDGNAVYKSTLAGGAPAIIVSGEKGIEGIVSDPGPQRYVVRPTITRNISTVDTRLWLLIVVHMLER